MDSELIFRLAFPAVLIVSIGISAFYRVRARKVNKIERSDESASMQTARVVFTLPLLLAIIVTALKPEWMTWSLVSFPVALQWAGLALAVLVPLFLTWTLRSIGTNISETVLVKKDHQLVTNGPYRFIRHPLYTGGIALILALGLLASSWLFLSFAVIAALFMRLSIVPKEEEQLIAAFGDRYREYRRRTGALLPKL